MWLSNARLTGSIKAGLTGLRPFATFYREFMLLKSCENLMRLGRLRRGIAIFLIAFAFFDMTVIDMFFPQLCVDEQTSQSINSSLDATDKSDRKIADDLMVISSHDSQPDQDSHQSSADEDCFCCCSHIIPSRHVNVATLNSPPQPDDAALPSLPSAPPHGTYHPPRHS
jgi:hypothetical protein